MSVKAASYLSSKRPSIVALSWQLPHGPNLVIQSCRLTANFVSLPFIFCLTLTKLNETEIPNYSANAVIYYMKLLHGPDYYDNINSEI